MTQPPIDEFDMTLLTTDAEVARELFGALEAAQVDIDGIELERRPTPEPLELDWEDE